jgi:predicted dehydrogenase
MGLKAAIIGLGVGERHIAGYEADPRCQVTVLCDIDPVKLSEVGARHPGRTLATDPLAVLADPDIDVVSIASYDDAHYPQIMAALAAGKHIFVEKPLCLTGEELAEIRGGLARQPRLRLSSNLILRRSPRFSALHKRLRAGELGRPYYVEADYNYGRLAKILSGWRATMPGYSVVHGGGIHMIDLVLWLLGERPVSVTAVGNRLCAEGSDFVSADCVVALLTFPSGAIAKVAANFGCVFPHWHNLTVYGTEATFQHGYDGARLFTSRDPKDQPAAVTDGYPDMAKGDMLPTFVASILDGGDPEVTEADVFDAMAVSIAIEGAMRAGTRLDVHYQ